MQMTTDKVKVIRERIKEAPDRKKKKKGAIIVFIIIIYFTLVVTIELNPIIEVNA